MNNNYEFFTKPKGGGFAFAVLMLIYIFISFFGSTIVGAIFNSGSVIYTAICSCFSIVSMAIIILAYKLKTKEKLVLLTRAKSFKWFYALIAVLLSAAMLFGLGFVNDAFIKLLESAGAFIPSATFPIDSVENVIIFSVVLALLPAVFEEVFFRGLLLRCFDGVKPVYAVIAVALSFSFYHCSAAQLVYQFIYGAALTMLALASGSIFPCIIAHFLNNFTIILLEYFKTYIDFYNVAFISVGIIALVFIFVFLAFAIKKNKKEQTNESIKGFYLFGALGIFACALMLVSALFLPSGA